MNAQDLYKNPNSLIGSDYFGWWRCRDLNPGHCGYEPHALTT
jgi:hypothetical protein